MATTTPDNIQYPVNSDQVAPLASHFKNLADSTQAALNNKASSTALSTEITDRTNADTALQNQINDIKQTSRVYVKNGASSLTKGTPVYITGADGTNVIIGAASNASEATSSKVIGLTETDLTANAMGYVVTDGRLTNIDTSGAGAVGDPVWLGVNGAKLYGLANKPVAPAHMVYLGVVSRKNANTGEIEVKVQNGFELDELHNVSISSPANGQALTYDSSTQLWKNATPVSSLAGLSDVQLGSLSPNEVLKYNGTKWVNGTAAGGVTAAATAPDLVAAKQGDAWFDTNDGTLYVCYIDGDNTKQWVQVQANSALEGSILARLGTLESQAIAYGQMSPNYIINGGFDINQRGFTSTTASGYVLYDRWSSYQQGGGTSTFSAQDFTPGAAPSAAIEGTKFLRTVTTGYSAASSASLLTTKIEDVRTLSGQTATLSFWAKAASGTPKISAEFSQNFGTGGSSSVLINVGAVTISTSWQRYVLTVNVPNISGKTIGANSFISTDLWVNAGADFASRTNSIGIQNNTFDIWGVQLERGSVATAFRRNAPSIQAELAACQRYYYRRTANGIQYAKLAQGYHISSTVAWVTVDFPVEMRAIPAQTLEWTTNVADYDQYGGNGKPTGIALGAWPNTTNYGGIGYTVTSATVGTVATLTSFTGSAYVGFSAEL